MGADMLEACVFPCSKIIIIIIVVDVVGIIIIIIIITMICIITTIFRVITVIINPHPHFHTFFLSKAAMPRR